jgi:competence protein ComEC
MLIESIGLGLISGAACYSQFSQIIAIHPVIEIILLLSIPACFYFSYKVKNQKIKNNRLGLYLLTILLSFIFELLLANYQAQKLLAWQLPAIYHNQILELKGKISGVPYAEKNSDTTKNIKTQDVKLILLAQELCLVGRCEKLDTPQKIKLYGQILLDNKQMLHAGDSLTVIAKIKKPWGLSNPGGYDAEKNLFFNQIKATGNIQKLVSHQVSCHTIFSFNIDKLRQKISDNMLASLEKDKLSGMLIGLTIGVTDRITSNQWALLRETGTTHLIAISGLHISLIGGLIFGVMNFFWRRAERLVLWLPAKIAAAYLTLIFTWGYGWLAGMSIATERACLMMTALMLAIILKLRMSATFVFGLSLVVILLMDPFAVLSMGFWLSYLAIGVLMFATGNRVWFSPEQHISKLLRPQVAVFIGLLPVSLYFFQSASLISPLINLIAIPWVSFVVTPACLLSALAFMLNLDWLGSLFIILAKYLYWPLWEGMQWIIKLFPMIWHFALPSGALGLGWFVLSMLGVLILLLPKGVPYKKRIGSCLAGSLLFYQPANLKMDECQFALLDIGQGLASVVLTKNHVLIYDVGPKWKENDSGTQIIEPFLNYYHIKNIDSIMISHTDLDHRGGLDSLLMHYKINKLYTSEVERLTKKADLNHNQPILCQAGQSWVWDGVAFEVLHPSLESSAGMLQKNRNNLSCVLKVSTGKSSILLTGDIESEAEKILVNTYRQKLGSSILIAPHHGSQTSSTPDFIEQVKPDYVLFPTGKDNRFGFPRAAVITRYQELGSQLYNTAAHGAILFKLTPEGVGQPIVWREKQTRFWHGLGETS